MDPPSTPFAAASASPFAPPFTPPRPVAAATAPSLTPAAKKPGLRGLVAICAAGMGRAPSAAFDAGAGGTRPAGRVEIVGTAHVTHAIRGLAKSVVRGLRAHQPPLVAPGGLGGTYFFRDERGRHAAIVKPCDEEPLAPNNPNGYVGRALGEPGLKPSVRVGEAAMREVAAYLLDGGFARVPPTVLVCVSHPVFHTAAAAAGAGGGSGAPAATASARYAPSLPAVPATPRASGDGGAGAAADADAAVPTPPTDDSVASTARAPPPPVHVHARLPLPAGSLAAALRARTVSGDLAAAAASSPPRRPPPKLASMQRYVPHDADASDVGPSSFPVADVHRIGMLDVRVFNSDRHAGNVLVCRRRRASSSRGGGASGDGARPAARPPAPAAGRPATTLLPGDRDCALVPIDHGFCLPEALEPPFFEWLFWPQAMQPFGPAERAHVAALDLDADLDLLRRELPSLHVGCLRVLAIGTTVLKRGVAAGLTLFELGSALSRPLVGMDEEPSAVERLCWAAREAALASEEEAAADAGGAASRPRSATTMTRAATCPALAPASPAAAATFGAAELERRTDADTLFGIDSAPLSDGVLSPTPSDSPATPAPWGMASGPSFSLATSVGSCDAAAGSGRLHPRRASVGAAPAPGPPLPRAASAALPSTDKRATLDGADRPSPASPRVPTGPRAVARGAPRRPAGRAAAYPPPVVAAAPGAAVPLADLSEGAWAVFMRVFEAGLADELASGAWRGGGGRGGGRGRPVGRVGAGVMDKRASEKTKRERL